MFLSIVVINRHSSKNLNFAIGNIKKNTALNNEFAKKIYSLGNKKILIK